MGKHKHGAIVKHVFADLNLFDALAVRNQKLGIRPFRIHNVNGEMLAPTVFFHGFTVFFGCVASAVVGGVAFNHGSVHIIDDGLPKFRFQKVLIAGFARMQFYGNFAGKNSAGQVIRCRMKKLNHLFGRDFGRKKHFRFHLRDSLQWIN